MVEPLVSDTLLARITLAGDQKAFTTLVLRHHAAMFHFTYYFLGNQQQACDVLQETFLRFYHALPAETAKEASFKLSLFQMAYNCCIDELRRRSGISYPLTQLYGKQDIGEDQCVYPEGNVAPSLASLAGSPDLQSVLQRSIMRLPPRQRAVAILRYVSRLSFAEIGRVLQMSERAAQTCFTQSKRELSRYLQERQALIAVSLEKM